MPTILALDPGSVNFGVSVVSGEVANPKVHYMGLHPAPVNRLNDDLGQDLLRFNSHLLTLIRKHNVTHVLAERYMSRGMGGTTIESVNIMLGALSFLAAMRRLKLAVIPASQWKNEVGRNGFDLKAFYKDSSAKPLRCPAHPIDAAFIGLYGLHVIEGLKPFAPPTDIRSWGEMVQVAILAQLEENPRAFKLPKH